MSRRSIAGAKLGGRTMRTLVLTAAVIAAVGVASALANAPNPNTDIVATGVLNANGSVTVHVSGTWSWPGQNCAGRYGEGWAVDWWGISASQTPSPSFSLTNATEVNPPGTTTTGTISPFGAIQIHGTNGAPNTFFHVPQYYAGETINSASTCTDTGSGSTAASNGSWSAQATYPSQADLPAQLCVNMYDEHGSEGKISNSANDFSPSKDNDNSIQTNHFSPSGGSCATISIVTQTIAGHIYLCKEGKPTATEVPGGSLAATGPQTIAAQPNPLGPTKVAAGTYTMTETNPAGFKLASACGTTSSTQSVVVPSGGAGVGIFYVIPIPSYQAFVGYADTFRPPAGSTGTPSPWQGSPNVTFIGCNPSFLHPGGDQCPQTGNFGVFPNRDYVDGGAIRFDNPTGAAPLTVSNMTVQINGPLNSPTCTFNPWPGLNVTVSPGQTLILSETGVTTKSACTPNGENFDTSEVNQTTCANDGYIPVITVTLNGTVTTFRDTNQILNTGGFDHGDCGLAQNEEHAWSSISPG